MVQATSEKVTVEATVNAAGDSRPKDAVLEEPTTLAQVPEVVVKVQVVPENTPTEEANQAETKDKETAEAEGSAPSKADDTPMPDAKEVEEKSTVENPETEAADEKDVDVNCAKDEQQKDEAHSEAATSMEEDTENNKRKREESCNEETSSVTVSPTKKVKTAEVSKTPTNTPVQ